MLLEHIEKMRTKPEHVRRRYAFGVSLSITGLIFAGWIASYGLKSSPVLSDANTKVDAPVSSLAATAIGAWTDIKSLFSGSNKTEYSSVEVTGGKR